MRYLVLILSTCLVSCHFPDREMKREPDHREQIMNEILRLDLMRKKIGEIVAEKKVAVSLKRRKYAEWEENILDRLMRMDRASKTFSNAKQEMDEGSMIFRKEIVILELDMEIMKTIYDSLDAEICREVAKLGRREK